MTEVPSTIGQTDEKRALSPTTPEVALDTLPDDVEAPDPNSPEGIRAELTAQLQEDTLTDLERIVGDHVDLKNRVADLQARLEQAQERSTWGQIWRVAYFRGETVGQLQQEFTQAQRELRGRARSLGRVVDYSRQFADDSSINQILKAAA